MNAAEKIAHAAERKAFEAMLDSLIRKSQTKDVCTVANDFVNMVQKIHSSVWTPETFEMLHQIANDPDSKWAHYAERLLRECDPYLLRTFLTAAAYEGGFRGFQRARANSEKYDCNIPWIVLMDPTSACNMRCAGCWAAEYGHKQNLTFEEMDGVLTEETAIDPVVGIRRDGTDDVAWVDVFDADGHFPVEIVDDGRPQQAPHVGQHGIPGGVAGLVLLEEVLACAFSRDDDGVPAQFEAPFQRGEQAAVAVQLERRFGDEHEVGLTQSEGGLRRDESGLAAHELDDADAVGRAHGFHMRAADGFGGLVHGGVETK